LISAASACSNISSEATHMAAAWDTNVCVA